VDPSLARLVGAGAPSPLGARARAYRRGSAVMKDLVIQAFDAVIQREIAEADEVREEIRRRGTHWAGDEIWKLRRQVSALRKRLAEHAEHDGGSLS